MTAPDPALLAEIDSLMARQSAREDVLAVLVREVADLRVALRQIRDLSSEETIRAIAATRLLQ